MQRYDYASPCTKCGKYTGHKSVMCVECRKINCLRCGVKFSALKITTKFCGNCKHMKMEDKIDFLYSNNKKPKE